MNFDSQNIFFISDLHIGHKNVIKFDSRPFVDVDEMHVELINRWNSVVSADDVVFFLGDLAFARDELIKWFIYSLNGKIHFILGNHDKMDHIMKFNRWETIHESYTEIGVLDTDSKESRGFGGYQKIILSHYPILSWNKAHYGSWHLHGHCHGSLVKSNQEYYKRKVLDVGCNCIDYTPLSYEKLKILMNKKIVSTVDHHEI